MVLNLLNRVKSEEELDSSAEKTRIENELSYISNSRTIMQDLLEKAVVLDHRYLYF